MDGSTSGHRLHPYSRAGNSHHHHYPSDRPLFQSESAAATAAHFSSQPDPGCEAYQLPPSPLSHATYASAGGAGAGAGVSVDNTISMDIASGSGCAAAGSSSYQWSPSLLPQTHFSGGGGLHGGSAAWSSMPPPSSLAPDPVPTLGGGLDVSGSSSGTTMPCYATFHPSGSGCAAAGSSSYQWQPSLLPQTQFSGGVMDAVGSAACDALALQGALPGSSMPPPSSLAPVALDPTLGGGFDVSGSSSCTTMSMPCHATFHPSLDTGLGSVVDLPPLTSFTDLPASSSAWPPSLVDLQASSSSTQPLFTQNAAGADFGLAQEEYELPPLPPSLGGPPPLQTATAVGLEAARPASSPVYILIEDDDDEPPARADPRAKKKAVDWSSWQLGSNTMATNGSSSMWTAPVPSSNSLLAPAANFAVKKEAVDWSWQTSQKLGKNTIITGRGSSSALMPQPANSSANVVVGNKQNRVSSPWTGWGSGAPGSSIRYKEDATSSALVPKFADGLFTQNDIYKIMESKSLRDMVVTDPKRVRRLLRNPKSAERVTSTTKKETHYLSDLERKVQLLQEENKSLSAQVNSLQSTTLSLKAGNYEMMTKLHGVEQQTQHMNDINETLKAEVYHLKLAVGEIGGSHVSSSSYQEMTPQMMTHEKLQMHDHQLAQFQQEQEQPADLDMLMMQQIEQGRFT